MNSWRLSSHFWPVSVRKRIAAIHSSMVGSTSRTTACRWVTTEVMISFSRASLQPDMRSRTAAVAVCSLKSRMGHLL